MKVIKIIFTLIIFIFSTLSFADSMRGEDLYSACRGNNQFDLGFCIGFIRGHIETTAMFEPCITAIGNVSFHQIREIFNKYAKDNPKDWNLPEVRLLEKAITNSYRKEFEECQQTKK